MSNTTAIKTHRAWNDSRPHLDIEEYLQPGDEVDEEMYHHFGGVVSPEYCTRNFLQVGEPVREEAGRYHYLTFGIFGTRHVYLGVLPPFKQPKF